MSVLKIQRNAPCPCGSGLKYKKCCGASQITKLAGLVPGLRMKGGVAYDPEINGFVVIVHSWDNIACQGMPKEWRGEDVFSSEDEAMQYYKTNIRPGLERMMKQMEQEHQGMHSLHRKLE